MEAPPAVVHLAGELDRQRDRPGDAVHGQVAGDAKAPVGLLLDPVADELDRRIGRCVEEVGRAQVVVALLVAGVDRGRLDLEDHRGVGRILVVLDDRARELAEVPVHLADVMADLEGDVGVRLVDRVGQGRRGRRIERGERDKGENGGETLHAPLDLSRPGPSRSSTRG